MSDLKKVVNQYLGALGLAPGDFTEYWRRLNDPQAYVPPAYDASMQAPAPQPAPEQPTGIGWGMYTDVLKPKKGNPDADIEMLQRARLYQVLAPQALKELLAR